MPQVTSSWFDTMCDLMIEEGTKAGRIFEFSMTLSPEYLPGGIMETTTGVETGDLPKKLTDIKRVIVQNVAGQEVILGIDSPHVKKRFLLMIRNLK